MHKHLIGSLLVVTALFVCPARAAAQADTFLFIAGIPGDSTDEAHKDWINVFSVAQDFDVAVKASACGAAIAKGYDKAGPLLWLAAVTGQRLGEVRIEVIQAGGDTRQKFYDLRISNARILAISSTPSSLSESLQIAGDSATLTYYSQSIGGGTVAAPPATVTCK